LSALGATPVATVPGGPLGGLDGIEADLGVIKGNGYNQQAKALTANVTLWPKPVTVVINRKVFESLTASQQDALRQAGSVAVSRQAAVQEGLNDEDRGILCQRGLRFVRASDRELATLRRAVQPVYDRLERNPQTKSVLQRIQAMKRETAAAPDAPACSPSSAAPATASQQATTLDGVYRTSFTREELAASPLLLDQGEVNEGNWGQFTLTFNHGRVTLAGRNDRGSGSTSGTYTINGKTITLRFAEGVNAGETFAAHWNLYRDVLTFKRDPSLGELPTGYLVKPWRRVG
jgi:Bacterial extracellular solute-binding protein, family 7